MFNRIQGWQSVGRFGWTWANIEYRGWCVQVCKPAWNFHILFRVQSFHVESGRRARRQPPADGLNNRRRENEVEGKKKGGKARGNPASRLLRDTSRYRRVVVDRSFDDSGRRERFNSCLPDYVRGRGCPLLPHPLHRYSAAVAEAAGYRCIFNTETKRYNPRLIGKLHVAVSLFDTNRGKTPNPSPSRASHCASIPLSNRDSPPQI